MGKLCTNMLDTYARCLVGGSGTTEPDARVRFAAEGDVPAALVGKRHALRAGAHACIAPGMTWTFHRHATPPACIRIAIARRSADGKQLKLRARGQCVGSRRGNVLARLAASIAYAGLQ